MRAPEAQVKAPEAQVSPEALKAPCQAPFSCQRAGLPLGHRDGLQLPWCALGSSPLLRPDLGSSQRASGPQCAGRAGESPSPSNHWAAVSGTVPRADRSREGQMEGEGLASSGLLRRGDGRRPQ